MLLIESIYTKLLTHPKFKTDWQAYPGAVSVWENNFSHVEQLYNYGSAIYHYF